ATFSPRSSSTSPSHTRAPSATKRRAIASPVPRAAPVTIATFPSSRRMPLLPRAPPTARREARMIPGAGSAPEGGSTLHVMMPDLYIKPEYREAYIEAIVHEVKQGLAKEPGILRFDLVQDHGDPNVIHVYAVYRDRAALEFHQQQPYYVEFM